MPQSAVSSNLQILEDAGLVTTESRKAGKGSQKICRTAFTEILAGFRDDLPEAGDGAIEVIHATRSLHFLRGNQRCGLCSPNGVIGLFDVPDTFLCPPMGVALFVVARLGDIPYHRLAVAILPWLIPPLIVLALATFVPQLSTAVPGLLG